MNCLACVIHMRFCVQIFQSYVNVTDAQYFCILKDFDWKELEQFPIIKMLLYQVRIYILNVHSSVVCM